MTELLFGALALAGGVVMVGSGALYLNRSWQRTQRQVLMKVAERVSGRVVRGSMLMGWRLEIERAELGTLTLQHVSVNEDRPAMGMQLALDLPRLLPLDALEHPAVADALAQLYAFGKGSILHSGVTPSASRGGTLLVASRRAWLGGVHELTGFVEAGLALGRALLEVADAPWLRLATRPGLELSREGPHGRPVLRGELDGIALDLAVREGPFRWAPTLVLGFPTLPGLVMRASQDGDPPVGERWRVATGNPVLDGMIYTTADEPQRLRSVLRDPALTPLLMEVLHGHPGSNLDHQGLVIWAPGVAGVRLDELVDLGLELARAFGAGVGELS